MNGLPWSAAPGGDLMLLLTQHHRLALFAGSGYVSPDHSNICFGGFSLLPLLSPSTSVNLSCGFLSQAKLLDLQ